MLQKEEDMNQMVVDGEASNSSDSWRPTSMALETTTGSTGNPPVGSIAVENVPIEQIARIDEKMIIWECKFSMKPADT